MKQITLLAIVLILFSCAKKDENITNETNEKSMDSVKEENLNLPKKEAQPKTIEQIIKITSPGIDTMASTNSVEVVKKKRENILLIPVGDATLRFENVIMEEPITIDSVRSVDTLTLFVSPFGGVIMGVCGEPLYVEKGDTADIKIEERVGNLVYIGYDGSGGVVDIDGLSPHYSEWQPVKAINDTTFELIEFNFYPQFKSYPKATRILARAALDSTIKVEEQNSMSGEKSTAELTTGVGRVELRISVGQAVKNIHFDMGQGD